MHREPDVGSDPRSPGSRPGAKAGAKPLRHPGIPEKIVLRSCWVAQSTKHLTLDFGSGHDLRVVRLNTICDAHRASVMSVKPAWYSLPLPNMCMHAHTLSLLVYMGETQEKK